MDGQAPIAIRAIEEKDVDTLLDLMGDLADNQNERDYLTVTADQLRRTGFGDHPQWRGFIAEADDKAAGYATYTQDFHIWSGAPRITLDDIYVRPAARSHGLGRKLIGAVFEKAREIGAYVSWTVQTDNHRAISLYEELGASYRIIGKCGWRPDGS